MRKSMLTVLSLLMVLSMVLSGCAQPTPTPAPKPTVAPAVAPTAVPKATEAPKAAPTTAPAAAATVAPTTAAAKGIKVGLVTDTGAIDDKSFNQTSWKGVQDAIAKLGVQGQYLQSKQPTDYAKNITEFLQQKYDMIVTVGFLLGEDTAKFAKDNPKTPFAIVDFAYDPTIPNVLGLTFATDQAAFMAGYLAAGMSKTGKVGTFGGMEIPTVTIFMVGFSNGVAHYNKINGTKVQVLGAKTYVGNFNSTDDGRRTAESLMDEGADVIMPVAGKVGEGSAAAVKERNKMFIGVDADMFNTMPATKDIIITSVLKNMDVSVFEAIKMVKDGTFKGGTFVGTLTNKGVGLAPYHEFESKVPQKLKDELKALEADLVSGKIATGWGVAAAPKAAEDTTKVLGEKVNITFWHVQPPDDFRGKLLNEIIAEFMKKYPEITIEATFQGNYTDLNKKVMAAIAAKTPPDAAVGYPSMFSDYKTANAIVELDPYINDPKIGFTAEDLKDVFPAFMEECKFPQYGNKYYAFPFTKSALGLYYNLDLIKAAGFSAPPKTWKEFEEQCLAITKKTGKKAYAYKDDASTVDGFFFSRGVYQLNPDQTKAIFNGPEHVEALAMVKRLMDAGAAFKPEGANADQAAFGKGDVAFTFGSTSGLFYYKQAVTTSGNAVKQWGHTIIPQTDPKNAKTVLYGGSFVVFKSTEIKQKAAWLFLKYFTSTEVTAKWGSQSGYFPVRASAAALLKDYFAKDPIAKEQWETIVPYGYPEPSVRGEQSIRDYLVEAITASNEGVKTTKQALDDAIKKADDALAKGRQ